eukprot:9401843-Alexandrium_andersonii.AAC.1
MISTCVLPGGARALHSCVSTWPQGGAATQPPMVPVERAARAREGPRHCHVEGGFRQPVCFAKAR